MRLEFSDGSITVDVGTEVVHYRFEFRLPESQGVVVVDDPEVRVPRGRELECRADGLWFACICETQGEHWSFGLEAFGLRYDDMAAVAAAGYGDRLPVGYDLEWEMNGADGKGTIRGEILVADDVFELDDFGVFSV